MTDAWAFRGFRFPGALGANGVACGTSPALATARSGCASTSAISSATLAEHEHVGAAPPTMPAPTMPTFTLAP